MIYKWFPWLYTRSKFIASLPDYGSVLDVGCGTAPLYKYFCELKQNIKLYGTDIIRSSGLPDGIKFVESDLNSRINFSDDMFDVVICSHLIEHLDHVGNAMTEIVRVLKPGGVLYLETPSHRSIFFPSFNMVNKGESVPISFWDDPTHLRPFSPISLVDLCKRADLVPVKSGYARNWLALATCWGTFPLAFILQRRAYLVHSLWHLFGWSSYVIAKKIETV